MEALDASNSDSEIMSENEMVSNTKRKRKQNTKGKKKENPVIQIEKTIRSDHFQETDIANIVQCTYCHRTIGCAPKSGATPCTNHIHACKEYPPNVDLRQSLHDLESKRRPRSSDEVSVETVTTPVLRDPNQEVLEKALVEMLKIDKMPFSFVESDGFREFCKVINPNFVIPSRSSLSTIVPDEIPDE